jgi:hypothetical protein
MYPAPKATGFHLALTAAVDLMAASPSYGDDPKASVTGNFVPTLAVGTTLRPPGYDANDVGDVLGKLQLLTSARVPFDARPAALRLGLGVSSLEVLNAVFGSGPARSGGKYDGLSILFLALVPSAVRVSADFTFANGSPIDQWVVQTGLDF